MTISFLRHLPVLSGPRVMQVVAASNSQRAIGAKALLDQLLEQVPELLVALVLDVQSGQPLASYTTERRYQAATIAASVATVVQQVQANLASQAAFLPASQLQEVLLTLSTQLHLSCLGTRGQLLYLAVNTYDTNLELARQLARQAMNDFELL